MRSAVAAISLSMALLVLVPADPARAQEKGPYIGGAAGLSLPLDSDADDGITDRTIEYDPGYSVSGALGYAFGNAWRAELDLGLLANDVDSVTGAAGASGDVDAFKFMGNVLYDLHNTGLPVTPYIGFGVGGVRISADGIDPFSNTRIDDNDLTFGYQAIAGASHALTDRLSLTLDYRFLNAPDVDLRTDTGVDVDADYAAHSFMVGLRYRFGAPPKPMPEPEPAAAPAPKVEAKPEPKPEPKPAAPAPPRTYLVFFDWNRANLKDDAKEIIGTAVDNLDALGGIVRIVLTGHADRSGPDAYNVRLSQRRADSVMNELQRLGVKQQEIVTFARGESEPLVPTGDGVREPRNRRVEIVLE